MKQLIFLLIICTNLLTFAQSEQLRNELEVDKTLPSNIRQFYSERAFKPFWGVDQIELLKKEIIECLYDGLNPSSYSINIGQDKSNLLVLAKNDIQITKLFLTFTKHLYAGQINPTLIDPNWKIQTLDFNESEILKRLNSGDGIGEIISSVKPNSAIYLSLKKELKKILKSPYEYSNIPIPLKSIEFQDTSHLVVHIKKRLRLLGFYSQPDNTPTFDNQLKDALTKFQIKYNLSQDGKIGKLTIQQLNKGSKERINQLLVNLERIKWLPKTFAADRITVNTAQFILQKFDGNQLTYETKVIVGKSARQTPVFHSTMTYLVINPTWTVPPGILRNDLIPASRKSTDYVKSKNIQILTSEGKLVNPEAIDWKSQEPYKYTYRQPAGKDNALGAVKFMFPNPYSIYIHDTPTKNLFQSEERAFSSGCIRVEHPLILAEKILDKQDQWNIQNIESAVNKGITTTVTLKKSYEVYLVYFTVFCSNNQEVIFTKDIYDRDEKILKLLR